MNKRKCEGKMYRGHVNAFLNTKGEYVYRERMVPLKRQSCPGCLNCDSLSELLNEFVSLGTTDSYPIIRDIEDGALYGLRVVNESKDWEIGTTDDFDLEFVKIEESK